MCKQDHFTQNKICFMTFSSSIMRPDLIEFPLHNPEISLLVKFWNKSIEILPSFFIVAHWNKAITISSITVIWIRNYNWSRDLWNFSSSNIWLKPKHGSSDGSAFASHTDDLRVVGSNLARSNETRFDWRLLFED